MTDNTDWHNCRVVLRKTSLIDYAGLISAVIFFPGCNLRCPWCHNRELVLNSGTNAGYISLKDALKHIAKRKNVLGGVTLSGGEPTLFSGLGALISHIKSFDLLVKLDTNGLLPEVLQSLFETKETRPDYIAMDLKTSPDRYIDLLPDKTIANGTEKDGINPAYAITQSAALIRASGILHEFRSLALPEGNAALPANSGQKPFFDEETKTVLAAIAGDSPWNIRPFIPGNCVDPAWDVYSATLP